MVTPPATLLDALRAETRRAHHTLDSRIGISETGFSRAHYVALLRATLAVTLALEPPLRQRLPPPLDWPGPAADQGGSERVERLCHDLVALDASADIAPLADVPAIATPAAAVGAAYVLQGSMLGGAVIARIVHNQPCMSSQQTTYLRLYGDNLGRMWRDFTDRVNAFGRQQPPAEWTVATHAAVATFSAFARALDREGVA